MAATIQPRPVTSPPMRFPASRLPLDSPGGVSNVLAKVDATNLAHRDNAPVYRQARYKSAALGHRDGPKSLDASPQRSPGQLQFLLAGK